MNTCNTQIFLLVNYDLLKLKIGRKLTLATLQYLFWSITIHWNPKLRDIVNTSTPRTHLDPHIPWQSFVYGLFTFPYSLRCRLDHLNAHPEETPNICFRVDVAAMREAIRKFGRVDSNGLPLETKCLCWPNFAIHVLATIIWRLWGCWTSCIVQASL